MADEIDWEEVRRTAFAEINTPPHWPADVRPISIDGLILLGLDARHRLYWDGERVQTKLVFPKGIDWAAWLASISAFVIALDVVCDRFFA